MAAKKKSSDNGNRGMNQQGKTVKWFAPGKGPKPTEAFTAKGQKATGLAKSNVKNRFSISAKTPVKKADKGFSGSGSPLGTGFALSQPTKPSNLVKAAAATAGLASVGRAAANFTIQPVVSEATKKLQRQLSKDLKRGSNKDIRNLPKQEREEIAYGRYEQRVQSEADFRDSKLYQEELRKKIGESMRTTTKKKVVRQVPKKR